MSDTNEKITVEVDGDAASAGFGRIKANAADADRAIDSVGTTADSTGRKLRDLGSSTQKAGEEAKNAKSKFEELQASLFSSTRTKVAWLWDMAADGFRSAIGFADAFIDKIAGVQRTISLLSNIPGANVGDEFGYLIGIANKYGLSLQSIQNDYAKYTLSAQGAVGMNGKVQRTFEQVAMSVRTLHMSQQQAQFTFLALEQMLSKGQVSLQELRRQFSERIPGAMQALARELGVTMPQLLQFITKVGAASDKLLPHLGDALQRMFQGGIQNASRALDAERNRLETSVTTFLERVISTGGADGMARLLRSLNDLLQSESIANVFSNAMNLITDKVTKFLKSLDSETIESFAKTALEFLAAFTTLTIAAAKAVIYLGQHLPEVAAAFGAFVGASAGSRFGAWGAGIGLILGGAAGYAAGASVKDGMGPNSTDLADKLTSVEKDIAEYNKRLNNPGVSDKVAYFMNPQWRASDQALLKQKLAERAQLNMQLAIAGSDDFNDRNQAMDLPFLKDLPPMMTGDVMGQLNKLIGFNGPNTKLVGRQQTFLENLLSKVQATQAPEEARFDRIILDAKRLGLGPTSKLPGSEMTVQGAVDALQAHANAQKQEQSDKKTSSIEQQFTNMMTLTTSDIDKFKENYNIANLLTPDEQTWQNKAQQMESQLNKTLTQLSSEWTRRQKENPLFMLGFDKDAEMKKMREFGQAYIDEFKRIEAERRSVMGGTKSFLKDWNEQANNFGKITYDFLQGVTNNIVDMMTNMVMTGRLSFAELTKFVLSYIVKLLLVQALTPFINFMASGLSSAMSSILSIGSSAGSSLYSLGTGNSGLGLKLPGRASGGPVWPGQKFIVGENGPEVVQFGRSGYVYPNGSGPSGESITVQVNVDAHGVSSSSNDNQFNDLGRKIGDAVRAVIVTEKRPGGLLAA